MTWQETWTYVGPLAGVIIGSALNHFFGTRRADKDRKEARAAKLAEREARLRALGELLWLDLGEKIMRLDAAASTKDMDLDTSLWERIRVDLVDAGLSGRTMFNLMGLYQLMNTWNSRLKELQYSRTPEPGRASMIEGMQAVADLLRPMVSPELIAKVAPKAG